MAEHERECIQDGAYQIDVGKLDNIRELYKEIDDELELRLPKVDKNSILKSSMFKTNKFVLVFDNVSQKKERLFIEIVELIRKFSETVKVIVILKDQDLVESKIRNLLGEVQHQSMSYLNEGEAVKFLKRVLRVTGMEKKINDLDAQIKADSPIMQKWAELYKLSEFWAFSIARLLEEKTLEEIIEQMEEKIQKHADAKAKNEEL